MIELEAADEIERLRADAERYRWIRSCSGSLFIERAGAPGRGLRLAGEFDPMTGFFDDAIDQARARAAAPEAKP